MANWMGLIPGILYPNGNRGVLLGGCTGMAIGGPFGAAIGGVFGRIVTDKLTTGEYNSYGISQTLENIRRDGITRATLWNVIETIPLICGDMFIGYQSGTCMASIIEENSGHMKREDDIINGNSESKKEMSDTTHNFDGETHAQSKSANADASEGEKAPSMSSRSGNPADVKKDSTNPNMMDLKARKRPGSSQELFPDTKRFKISELTVPCSAEKSQTICTRLGRISSSSMARI